jgi:DNA-binding SARP family transcriptional activator
MTMVPLLKVQLLGNFRIFLNQQDISVTFSERVKLLFAYLLLNPQALISRKQIAFTFWPESSESQARTNLRNLLYLFRKSLPKTESFFEIDSQFIKWRNNKHINLDVQKFWESISATETCQSNRERISYLQQAVNSYRGELLPDLYEDWLLKQREELHQSFVNALFTLSALLEEERQYPEAIQAMNRLILSDPLNELAYQRSMRFHALNNDRAGALKVYHACSTVLRQELDIEPSQDTRVYYEQILQLHASAAITTKEKRSLDTKKMIGRQGEWKKLRDIWEKTVQSEPGVALILGEAGIGKTHLTKEMAQWTRRQGIQTALAQCYPGEGELPFAPIVSWLRTPEFKKEIEDLESLWQGELARLLPEYKTPHIKAYQSEMNQKWQRRRLFEAIAKGIIGHRKPRLLILDDAQWSDQDTLDFIHYLLRYDNTAPVLIVLTARTEELISSNPVNQLRVLLQSKGNLQEIELESLKKKEIRELAVDLTSNTVQEKLINRLYSESEGNPLFVVEMLRSGENAMPDSLPTSIRSLLEYRLSQLSPSASELVGVASAIGREFSYRLLEAACGLGIDALVHGLDELWLRRIIQNQQEDNYNFTHGKLRDTAYAALSESRRRLNHRRIAEAYILISGEESGQAAKHFELAGQYHYAVKHYIEAAKASRRMFANQVAKLYLERALSLIPEGLEILWRQPNESAHPWKNCKG